MLAHRTISGPFLALVGVGTQLFLIFGTVPYAFAAAPVTFEKLSSSQQATTLPDSTVVKVGGKLTTTLGKLRASHNAREQARVDAKSKGGAAGTSLKAKQLRILRLSKQAGRVLMNLATPVVEPSFSYASAPADMRAFCAAAQASACAYLPPNQSVQRDPSGNGSIDDLDSQITDPQCSQEGGFMSSFGWGSRFCWFTYPGSVNVGFNPGDYQIATSASCNAPWTYNVDVHGAISITLGNTGPYLNWPSGSNPTCVVRVTVGP
jgi:hypothetical protein